MSREPDRQHELQRWRERHISELIAAKISSNLGRAPTLSSRRGATWISLQSKHALGRVVLSGVGYCAFTATSMDADERMNEGEEFTSSSRLDEIMSVLLGHLRCLPS